MSPQSKKTSLFLGVGNRDRGDDGVGPFLAEKFEKDGVLTQAGVDVIAHSGEGASLMSLWEGMEKVVVVDAMSSRRKAGLIQRFNALKEPLQGGVFRYSSHLFGLAEAVEMARTLGTLPKELIVYGIEGGQFTFGEPFCAPVAEAAGTVEKDVYRDFGLAE